MLSDAARKLGGHKTKKEAVTAALREYVKRRKQVRIIELDGTPLSCVRASWLHSPDVQAARLPTVQPQSLDLLSSEISSWQKKIRPLLQPVAVKNELDRFPGVEQILLAGRAQLEVASTCSVASIYPSQAEKRP